MITLLWLIGLSAVVGLSAYFSNPWWLLIYLAGSGVGLLIGRSK